MASTNSTTPGGRSDAKIDRVARERERRSKEKAAYNKLRHTLELADPKAFWRMEKVDIAEGAIYLIQRLTGGSDEQPSIREQIVFDEDKRPNQNEKIDRVEVEKRRRGRESKAIRELKELLITQTTDANPRMEKIEVITCASDLIKKLAGVQSSPIVTKSPDSGVGDTSITGSDAGPSPVSSPGTVGQPSSQTHEIYSQLMLAISMVQPAFSRPMSTPMSYHAPSPTSSSAPSGEPPAKKQRKDVWRPWE